MPIKVELHRDVGWFIRHRCTGPEQDEFYRMLEAIRSEPIKHSAMISDPQLSRYSLRYFRFGTNLAIFRYDAASDRIRILECRRVRPRRRKRKGPRPNGDGPG